MTLFGDEVKRLRTEKSLSQKGLGEAIGTSQAFISQIESGERQGLADVANTDAPCPLE